MPDNERPIKTAYILHGQVLESVTCAIQGLVVSPFQSDIVLLGKKENFTGSLVAPIYTLVLQRVILFCTVSTTYSLQLTGVSVEPAECRFYAGILSSWKATQVPNIATLE